MERQNIYDKKGNLLGWIEEAPSTLSIVGIVLVALAIIALLVWICIGIWPSILSEMPWTMVFLAVPVVHGFLLLRKGTTGFGTTFKKLFRSTFAGIAGFMLVSAIASAIAGKLNIILGLLSAALIAGVLSPLPALLGAVIFTLISIIQKRIQKNS